MVVENVHGEGSLSSQETDHVVQLVQTGYKHLKNLPFVNAHLLTGHAIFETVVDLPIPVSNRDGLDRFLNKASGSEITEIELARVISASSWESWADLYKYLHSEEIEEFSRNIQTGSWSLQRRADQVFDYNQERIFVVCGWSRTVALAKLLGLETIPARVIQTRIVGVAVFNEIEYQDLLARREQGLWQGTLEKTKGLAKRGDPYAVGKLTYLKGGWVLARDLQTAQIKYQEAGIVTSTP